MNETVNHHKRVRSGAGLGVDYAGNVLTDPTENVKALSEALSQRQDDLRDLNNKYLDARLDAMEKAACNRAKAEDAISQLRSNHTKEMRESESKRLDAIRQIDVSAVSTTAAQFLAATQTLATTTQATAETLRTQVANTATTIANQTDRIVSPIMERLAALEKASYTGQGKSDVTDPALKKLFDAVTVISDNQVASKGQQQGLSDSAKLLVGLLMFITALMGVYTFVNQRGTANVVPPVTINMPAAAPAAPSTVTTTTQPFPR
jgi:hypothetical protein